MTLPIYALSALTAALLAVSPTDIIRGFDPPPRPGAAGHRGVDYEAHTGDSVVAWASGTVGFVGTIADKPVVTVLLAGAGTPRHTYEPVTAVVTPGAPVRVGEILGYVAPGGGHCGGTAGCVHVGLRTDTGYLDPLTARPRLPPVLRPADEPARR